MGLLTPPVAVHDDGGRHRSGRGLFGKVGLERTTKKAAPVPIWKLRLLEPSFVYTHSSCSAQLSPTHLPPLFRRSARSSRYSPPVIGLFCPIHPLSLAFLIFPPERRLLGPTTSDATLAHKTYYSISPGHVRKWHVHILRTSDRLRSYSFSGISSPRS